MLPLLRAALRLAPVVALAALAAAPARADFVVNGNFSTPVAASGVITIPTGSTTIPGWTVITSAGSSTPASVDLVGANYFNGTPPGGGQYVDLDGTASAAGGPAAGGLQQAVAGLTAGLTYTLTFSYANNVSATSAGAVVSIDGASLNFSHAGSTFANPGFTTGTLTFTAGSGDLLSFRSTDPLSDQFGIILTNVSINAPAVPEPSSLALAGIGLASIATVRRIRRRPADA